MKQMKLLKKSKPKKKPNNPNQNQKERKTYRIVPMKKKEFFILLNNLSRSKSSKDQGVSF